MDTTIDEARNERETRWRWRCIDEKTKAKQAREGEERRTKNEEPGCERTKGEGRWFSDRCWSVEVEFGAVRDEKERVRE